MKVVCMSDTHGMYHKVDIPEGDVLVHAGDIFRAAYPTFDEYEAFAKWLGSLPHKRKVIVGGNHEKALEANSEVLEALLKLHSPETSYLEDSSVEIDGIKFYGSPRTPEFFNWAFMYERGKEAVDIWAGIPEDTDVLVTHGPPKGILDFVPYNDGGEVGCVDLRFRVEKVRPKAHIFGHIHCGYGQEEADGIQYVNASICTESYRPNNKAIVIEI